MVVFTNTSTGTYTANLWNFGDGTMSTMNDPLHTYMAGSLYTVTLIVSGPAGSSVMTKPAYITVWEKVYLPLVLRLY